MSRVWQGSIFRTSFGGIAVSGDNTRCSEDVPVLRFPGKGGLAVRSRVHFFARGAPGCRFGWSRAVFHVYLSEFSKANMKTVRILASVLENLGGMPLVRPAAT